MERRALIAGNWKMNTTIAEAQALAAEVVRVSAKFTDRDVAVAPPFTALAAVAKILGKTPVRLAAQNVHWETSGAYTGEISPAMLTDVGCSMAIVGHSERRHIFGESDELINRRIKGALAHGISPVFCIGETLDEREGGRTFAVLENQIRCGLAGVDITGTPELIIAYEPVWAIGTGKTASADQAQEVHSFIRGLIGEIYEKTLAGQTRILYGGSVKSDNINILMGEADIDGALVGGAALAVESFAGIISFSAT